MEADANMKGSAAGAGTKLSKHKSETPADRLEHSASKTKRGLRLEGPSVQNGPARCEIHPKGRLCTARTARILQGEIREF